MSAKSSCQVRSLPTSVAIFIHVIGRRITAFANLFRPYHATGRCGIQILKTLKVHNTSSVILIPGYKISILLPFLLYKPVARKLLNLCPGTRIVEEVSVAFYIVLVANWIILPCKIFTYFRRHFYSRDWTQNYSIRHFVPPLSRDWTS
jgi:hypothetical protein